MSALTQHSPTADLAFPQRLTGIFDIRPYAPEYSIHGLQQQATSDSTKTDDLTVGGLDVSQLQHSLSGLDVEEVRLRKRKLNQIYHECLLVESAQGAVTFAAMLLILAQHRLIDPEKSLK